jgi:hypothetical protein
MPASVPAFALLALLLAILPAASAAEPQGDREAVAGEAPFDALLMSVAAWVAEDRGTAVPDEMPRLVLLPRQRMIQTFDAARQPRADGRSRGETSDLLAFYNMRTRTIYMPSDWTGEDPAELSILVHEMVHHFQVVEDESFPCSGARERDAYAAQGRWLAQHGETLEGALAINPLFVLLTANCLY